MKIKSILKGTMFTFMVAGLLTSTVNAQTKPAQKSLKKDTTKRELPAKATKKEVKKDPLVGSRPLMHPKPAKKN